MTRNDQLDCTDIVFRLVDKTRWFNPNSEVDVIAEAFIRRDKPKDPDGLSVSCRCTVHDAFEALSRVRTVLSLNTGRIRALHNDRSRENLDVVRDDETHAAIVGVPYPEDDHATAEFLASRLLEQSRVALNRHECDSLRRRGKA